MIVSRIDFKSPRQRMWGILVNSTLATLPYGHESDSNGVVLTGIATNCYEDCLQEAHTLLAQGTGSANLQIVEFVPYDYTMQPNV
jgi:hypothetical protein